MAWLPLYNRASVNQIFSYVCQNNCIYTSTFICQSIVNKYYMIASPSAIGYAMVKPMCVCLMEVHKPHLNK